MKNKVSGIYKIVNLLNDKVYVGSSVDIKNRIKCHFFDLKNGLHHNEHLQKSYCKYGANNFKWEIIEIVDLIEDKLLFKKNLLEREQYWIDTLVVSNGIIVGYNVNLIAGSCLGRKLSEEHKKKLSLAKLGNKNPMFGKTYSIEEKKKLSEWSKNMSAEARQKISETSKGNKYRLGQKVSDETKQKMSNSNKGKRLGMKQTDEAKQKISEAGKGRFCSEETREKRRKSMIGKNKGKSYGKKE